MAVDAVSALLPLTAAGARFAALAEVHAADFGSRAERHDRENSFPFENWEAMKQSGFLAGPIDEALGGLGAVSIHDLVLAIGRLARGDPATAVGATMHLAAVWYFSRLLDRTEADGDRAVAAQLKRLLRLAARGRAIACVAMSETGTSLGWPATTATPVGDGYRIRGRKTFCTNSPIGTMFLASVRVSDGEGQERLGFALVPRGSSGLQVQANWDALGLRASGSNDVVFDDCLLPPLMVMASGPLGALSEEILPMVTVGALALSGAALGIAERAQELIVETVKTRRKGPSNRTLAERHPIQTLVAESEVDLCADRAVLAHTASTLDGAFGRGTAARSRRDLDQLMKEVQCAGMAIRRSAVTVVDRALTASGGSGYLSRSPLSRLYRDVRASLFMQPFSPLEAFEYIGRVTLDLDHDCGL